MASVATVPQTGLYLYGLTVAGLHVPVYPPGVGGARVGEIAEGRLAAVVSRVAVGNIRPQRSNLAAHHQVLRDLAARQPVLPVAFGTIVGSEEQLREVLCQNHDRLAARLDWLLGKVEMALKVFWETANIFEFFVATHEELEALRNRLFRPGRIPTLEEKLQLGKLFESLVEQSRERHTRRVVDALSPYCVEVRCLDCHEERMIVKLACLVEKGRQGQWEEGVATVARDFDNHYCFQYSGPWAPYNFAEIDLKLT